jgi:hypothetical protein
MDYGWQNLEQAGRNNSLKSLASNEDCTQRAATPQSSNIRDVPSPFATMISLPCPRRFCHPRTRRKAMQSFFLFGPRWLGFGM